jgi:hypothetical protein
VKFSSRSVLTVGTAVLSASAIAVTQSVQPAPPARPEPTIHLAAAVQPLALTPQQPLVSVLLDSPLRLLGPAAPLGELPPTPAPLAIPIAPNLADTIDNIYIAVEPWVRYGFEVATSIVRWIPYVGWFAGQIMVVYNFGQSIVASGVFNFTDFLRGDGGLVENVVDFGIDVGLAFVWLGLDEVAQFIPLPPFCCYPPRPPVEGPFLALEAVADPTETAELTMTAASVDDSSFADADEVQRLGEDVGDEQAAVGDEHVVGEEAADQGSEADATEADAAIEPDTDELDTDDPTDEDTTSTTDSSGDIDAKADVSDSDVDANADEETDVQAEENTDGADNTAPTTGDAGPDTTDADSAGDDGRVA